MTILHAIGWGLLAFIGTVFGLAWLSLRSGETKASDGEGVVAFVISGIVAVAVFLLCL